MPPNSSMIFVFDNPLQIMLCLNGTTLFDLFVTIMKLKLRNTAQNVNEYLILVIMVIFKSSRVPLCAKKEMVQDIQKKLSCVVLELPDGKDLYTNIVCSGDINITILASDSTTIKIIASPKRKYNVHDNGCYFSVYFGRWVAQGVRHSSWDNMNGTKDTDNETDSGCMNSVSGLNGVNGVNGVLGTEYANGVNGVNVMNGVNEKQDMTDAPTSITTTGGGNDNADSVNVNVNETNELKTDE